MNKVKKYFNTPDDSDIGYFVEVNLKCPNNIKEKTKFFPFAPENKECKKTVFCLSYGKNKTRYL